jgi:predicted metal-dependent HD superfamily phosphohydrolase
MNLLAAKSYILSRIEKELPHNLYYHSLQHVLDVEQAAIRIAHSEGITPYELDLLITAVAFHDSGFIYQANNHEEKGCDIVRESLPQFDYTPEEIDRICGMIMATKIPQQPHNLLEEIICDADLDYLGRDDFWDIGNNLYRELSVYGILNDEQDWNKLQYKFLSAHHYYTATAIELRQHTKEKHFAVIKNIIDSY